MAILSEVPVCFCMCVCVVMSDIRYDNVVSLYDRHGQRIQDAALPGYDVTNTDILPVYLLYSLLHCYMTLKITHM